MRRWLIGVLAAVMAGCGNDASLSRGGGEPSDTPAPEGPRVEGPALRVEATWTLAAEVDLHVLAPGGALQASERDCTPQSPCDPTHWQEDMAPPMDWGVPGELADNPRVSQDSFILGLHSGPETFDLAVSEDGEYRAVAFYEGLDSDGTAPPSCDDETTVTLRVWIGGALAWEGSQLLEWIGPSHWAWTGAVIRVDGETATAETSDALEQNPNGTSYPSSGC